MHKYNKQLIVRGGDRGQAASGRDKKGAAGARVKVQLRSLSYSVQAKERKTDNRHDLADQTNQPATEF